MRGDALHGVRGGGANAGVEDGPFEDASALVGGVEGEEDGVGGTQVEGVGAADLDEEPDAVVGVDAGDAVSMQPFADGEEGGFTALVDELPEDRFGESGHGAVVGAAARHRPEAGAEVVVVGAGVLVDEAEAFEGAKEAVDGAFGER